MRYLILLVSAVLLPALAGCAGTLAADPSKMNPEQLREMTKDRSAAASCTVVNSPWGVGRSVFVQLDKQAIPSGDVTVAPDCSVTVRSISTPKPTSTP